jgi:hypothetical protein
MIVVPSLLLAAAVPTADFAIVYWLGIVLFS